MIAISEGVVEVAKSATAQVYNGSFYGCQFDVDMIAVDPPWRQGNLSYWSRRAGTEQKWETFQQRLSETFSAKLVYLKTGVKESSEWIQLLQQAGKRRIVYWETVYYAGKNCQIVASNEIDLSGIAMDDDSKKSTTLLAAWAYRQGMRTAADPCLGKGVMLQKFQKAGMRVVGTELGLGRAELAAKRLCRD